MVDPYGQAIQRLKIIRASYGGPLWASHPKVENNKDDLRWILEGKPSNGRKLIDATYGGLFKQTIQRSEINKGMSFKGEKVLYSMFKIIVKSDIFNLRIIN